LTASLTIVVLTAILPDQTEETTILSAVLWKLAQGDRTLLQGRYFEQDAAGGKRQRIGNHEQAKNIRGSGSERTLYLVSDVCRYRFVSR
jgi:hypothetical protein